MSDPAADPAADPAGEDDETMVDDSGFAAGDAPRYLEYAALLGFALFAVVGAIGLYTSLGRVIGVWVAPEFRPLFRAGLNAVILLVAVVGVSVVARRLATDE